MAITPNAVDQYSRFMTEMFDEKSIIGVTTVWQSFFGNPAHGSKTHFNENSLVVEIDIVRGNERTAALIHRDKNSRDLTNPNTDGQNYSTFSRVYPLGEEKSSINASQLLSRVAGENPYQQMDRLTRMRLLASDYHMEHYRRYVRLFEILAGQSLFAGKMDAILGTSDANLQYDFRRNAANLITPATAWNAAGADILGDIDGGCDVLRENGHVRANVLFLAGNVCQVFLNDTTISSFADIRGYDLVRVGDSGFTFPANLKPLEDGGATAIGRLTTPQGRRLYLFTYDDVYTNAAGTTVNYLPDGYALLAYFGARCDRYFGPPELLPISAQKAAWYQDRFGFNMMAMPSIPNVKAAGGVINPAMFYNDGYEITDGKKITIRT